MDYVSLTETVNGIEQKILSQFVTDAARFEPSNLAPKLIVSFENIVAADTTNPLGLNIHEIRVKFITVENEEYFYLFDQLLGQLPGTFRLNRIPVE